MDAISRRSFMAISAGAATVPVWNSMTMAAETDVAIIGAGAAGIAAARRIIAAGKRVVLLEAGDRVGGRCITDTVLFDVPFDLGAHWLHEPDHNPVARLAPSNGMQIYPAPPG